MSKYGRDFWNERFAADGYLFGETPAVFLTEHADRLAPGSRILMPADGEGRNSVYLAKLGHRVVATEVAENAIAKARALAAREGVEVELEHVDLDEWAWPEAAFDAVVAIFIQFAPPAVRERMFAGIKGAVRPGGLLLLHGYTPKQLEYGTGGPKDVTHLYTEELLQSAFGDWDIDRLAAYERELDEGPGHSGMSAVIDLIARKPG